MSPTPGAIQTASALFMPADPQVGGIGVVKAKGKGEKLMLETSTLVEADDN